MIAKLGDIASYINGYAFKPSDWSNDGAPIIRIQDLTGNSYQMNRFAGAIDSKYVVIDGDILISWSASLGLYVWKGEQSYLNQHIFKVILDEKRVLKPFYIHQVKYILKKAEIQAHGATMKHLTRPVFNDLAFYLPDLMEQKKIADVLDCVSSLIDKHKQQMNALDELVKSRFIEMFGDPSANTLGWPEMRLEDACIKLTDGTHFSPESFATGEYKYITAKHIKADGFDFSNLTYVPEATHRPIFERCNPEYGDILYIKDGATTGIAMINTLKEEFTMLSSVALIKYNRNLLDGQYLKALLNYPTFYTIMRNNMGGAAITRLTVKKLCDTLIPLPPIDNQKHFSVFVEQSDKSKLAVQKSLEELETLKKSLMQEYFG